MIILSITTNFLCGWQLTVIQWVWNDETLAFSDMSIQVMKFGVKYDPPTFVIEYLNNANGKTYLKKIRLLGALGTDAVRLAERITSENDYLLAPKNVSRDQIISLMQIIIDKPSKQNNMGATTKTDYGDLNKASDVSYLLNPPENVASNRSGLLQT